MYAALSARTHFSIGTSILTPDALIGEAKAAGVKALAVTDEMTVAGMIEFTNRAKKEGIKPIIGARLRFVDDVTWRKTKDDKKGPQEYYLTFYVLKEPGLKALFRLLSKANSDDRFYEVPRLLFSDLYEELKTLDRDDAAIASSDAQSVGLHKDAVDILKRISAHVRAYMTLTPINTPYWDSVNKRAIILAEKLGLPCIITRPAFYRRGGADTTEIMNAISRGIKLADPWHNSPYSRDLHLMTEKEFLKECVDAAKRAVARGVKAGPVVKAALEANRELVNLIEYEWTKAPISLPQMAPDEHKALVTECVKGWNRRFRNPVFRYQPSRELLEKVYKPRLAYELEVLKKIGVSGYFLLVQDVVNYAKSNGILVGPGRGSVGGSLVAYLLGITDCDPVRFGLLFERFINPDRIDLPDADLDFMSARRHEVIEYLVGKYGRDHVAGISNFGTLGPASAIRDVGRVFGLTEADYRCSKLAPKEHGQAIKLTVAADQVREIGEYRDRYPDIWKHTVALEGVIRNLSQHAAGIVVSGCKLVDRAVVERRKGEAVVNWDKRTVEDQGLVKMDILGLSTLDHIALTLSYIRERHGKEINLLDIPLDDPDVLDNFAQGKTIGIFQFESGGMRRLLKELGSDGTITFDDITAATALYRPGPMDSGMMESYYLRKQGRESIDYDHPSMVDALKSTYGVMVYQEQVMQIARDLAGYSMADADKLRKIMGKKLPEEMAKERERFVEGCVRTNGLDEHEAGEIFDKVEKFAGYGFNKSHATEYALISYQSMWLKTHYPVEFYASALSLMKEDKLPGLLKDAAAAGIEILMPDINLSTGRFEILTDTKLIIPFNRVKGISDKTANAILVARKDGPFKSIADLNGRVERRLCNVRHVGILDKIGAFAGIEPGQLPANHPDRIMDQRELIPGLVAEAVPVHRDMHTDKATKIKIVELMREWRTRHGPEEMGGDGSGYPVSIKFGKKARFMVIADAPSREEEAERMTVGKSFTAVAEALAQNELTREDGYWTALSKEPKEGKQVTDEQIKRYEGYLKQEIELLRPPVIVLMGSQVVRHFISDFKGKASDSAGAVIYNKDLDANLVIGFNPGEIWFNPEKQDDLNEVFARVVSLLECS